MQATTTNKTFLSNYGNILLMLGGVLAGCILGLVFGEKVEVIKPVGDIFLNLLFTAVVPLVFFTISSSIASIDQSQKFGKLMLVMLLVFISTVLIAAITTLISVSLFPINAIQTNSSFTAINHNENKSLGEVIVNMFTVDDVYKLFSRSNMLPLMLFSGIIGFAVLRAGEKGKPFLHFLQSGSEVLTRFLLFIMKLAPIGLGAYFASQVGTLGPQLLGSYAKALGVFHAVCLFDYVVLFSIYAFIAGGWQAVRIYWRNNIAPSATAIGTCSSIATIPVNLMAANNMRIPSYIGNIAIPLGATLHKDGSSISSVIKIAAVFALFHKPFAGIDVLLIALLVTIVVSMVEGGIPSGGYLGELLVLSVYNFPAEAFPIVIILGTLVDPVATILNVTCDTAAGMLVSRIMEGKNWMRIEQR
jgi:Na+/H+-dicarboxylate symporter